MNTHNSNNWQRTARQNQKEEPFTASVKIPLNIAPSGNEMGSAFLDHKPHAPSSQPEAKDGPEERRKRPWSPLGSASNSRMQRLQWSEIRLAAAAAAVLWELSLLQSRTPTQTSLPAPSVLPTVLLRRDPGSPNLAR